MTPAEHIAQAEQLLAQAAEPGRWWDEGELLATALQSIGHALIGIAVELGAPHTAPASAVPSA